MKLKNINIINSDIKNINANFEIEIFNLIMTNKQINIIKGLKKFTKANNLNHFFALIKEKKTLLIIKKKIAMNK